MWPISRIGSSTCFSTNSLGKQKWLILNNIGNTFKKEQYNGQSMIAASSKDNGNGHLSKDNGQATERETNPTDWMC
jgi:hypothetical protein